MTEVDEVLKFDPGPNFKRPSQDDIVNEVLKFDPMRPKEEATPPPVGGTFQPKPSPIPGGAGPISTITGKPETRFVSGEESGAEFIAMALSGFVDKPYNKARIFSEARGIPVSRYRVTKEGEIEFKNDEGNWQREVSELPIHQIKQSLATVLSHPSTYLGTGGAIIGGPYGAIVGSMAGELIRKGVGSIIYGEEQTAFGNLIDVGMEGLFALGGELAGKIFTGGINKFLTRKIKPLQLAGQEVREQLLSPQDHAKALWIQRLADQHNITLAPHQLYDKEGMTNIWKYLRKHPVTSDAVRTFEDNLAKQSDEAINGFIKEMGGFKKTPYTLGEKTREVAEGAITKAEDMRATAAEPFYKTAREETRVAGIKADTSGSIKMIDDLMSETVKGDPSYSTLKRIKLMIEQTEGDIGKLDRVKRSGIDSVFEKSKIRTLKREMKLVKDELTSAMDAVSPEYAQARAIFAEKSEPVNRLKESVIGELSQLKTDKTVSGVAAKLLNIKNMPDEILLKEAKAIIFQKDPDLWNEIIGSYIRDVYQNLRIAEEGGKVLNVPGKMYKALYGNPKQRGILEAAMSSDQFKSFESLMQVFQRASIGVGKESIIAPFQAIGETMGVIPGSKIYRYAMFPKQAIVETVFKKWNDILVAGRQTELIKALASPDVIKKLEAIKPLKPGSKKFIEAFSVFTALIVDKVEIPEKQ